MSIRHDRSLRATTGSMAMMLRISWDASPGRFVIRTIVRVLADLSWPFEAVGLKLLADGVLDGEASTAITGAVIVAAAHVCGDGFTWAGMALYFAIRERVGRLLDRRLIELEASITGIEHHERADVQDDLHLLRESRSYLTDLSDATVNIGTLIVRGTLILVLLASVHPALLLLPLFGVPTVLLGGRAERAIIDATERAAEPRRLLNALFDIATSSQAGKEIRLFGLRRQLLERHEATWNAAVRPQDRAEVRAAFARTAGWACFATGFAGAISLVAVRAARGQASAGDVVMALALGSQLNAQVSNAVSQVTWFLRTVRESRRLFWLTRYAAALPIGSADDSPPARLTTGICFEDVSFAYPGTTSTVLEHVDIDLPAGSTIAIVGDNGAGKSTIVKLLTRMYEPTTGRITVDGVPLDQIDAVAWRGRIAAGFQDFAKLELIARHTVGAGDLRSIDDQQAVTAALERASAGDVRASLPHGLDTQLGRTYAPGAELSVGQWQKLALGRAMMRREPLLLVLDEPTSSLDADTEHALFERYAGAASSAARATGGITILVSHRFSTVRTADSILVVAGHRIAERGSHDELMARGGLYAELYELQARAYR